MRRAYTTAAQRTARSGFTLLELLIVIAIIAILMAILVPAISSVRYKARVAAVSAEMQQFEQSLATFQNKFGTYPPSSITLFGTQAAWDLAANAPQKSLIRSIWPDFDFSTGGRGDTSLHPWGTSDKTLDGEECLVFFLGGIPDYSSGDVPVMRGFSKNPRWPLALAGENRDGPYYTEFKGERLIDADSDGIPAYLDSLPGQKTPISYAAALNGRYPNGPVATTKQMIKRRGRRSPIRLFLLE